MDSIRPVKMQTDSRSRRYIDDPRNSNSIAVVCSSLDMYKTGRASAPVKILKFFDLTEVFADHSQDADRSASARVIVLHFSLNRPLSRS